MVSMNENRDVNDVHNVLMNCLIFFSDIGKPVSDSASFVVNVFEPLVFLFTV